MILVDVFIQYVYVPVNVRAMDKIPTENTYIIYIFQKAYKFLCTVLYVSVQNTFVVVTKCLYRTYVHTYICTSTTGYMNFRHFSGWN